MKLELLEILRCPFCGGTLTPDGEKPLELYDGALLNGMLECYCGKYPVVAGIPVMQVDYVAETALHELEQGHSEAALFALLELDEEKQEDFRAILRGDEPTTYRAAIELLSPDAEGTYFIYRFSDPTFLASQAVVRAVGQRFADKRVIDLCGGSGHLTRTLCQLTSEVVLADTGFAKLWLAQRFTAPQCSPICCDANNPLPFAEESFSLVVCSDAFHYIWSKRLLACEMMRLAGAHGTVLLPHVHNAEGENYSAGMPLEPQHYRALFANHHARLFRESTVLVGFLKGAGLDFTQDETDDALRDEAALVLIASQQRDLFRRYEPLQPQTLAGNVGLNPLYRVTTEGGQLHLELQFPSEIYAEEFAACLRYLPARLTLRASDIHPHNEELLRQFVLLDLPLGYC
ncbi:MAG TPA: methyltransferase domain-containing protein [Blastocatellia bacterium]|nr:methyltransferase domain-containing protein [Blastocatellia bacterium]